MQSSKGLLIFLVLLGGFFLEVLPAHANDKIVLMTSLDPKENRPPLRLKSWDINEKLEKRFYRYLKKVRADLQPVVKHFSTAEDLYKVLKDPQVKALIWVGHAGFGDQDLAQSRSIIDYKGRDLKALFQAAGPNLRYLGLVGCRGQQFLDEWQEKGYFNHLPQLVSYGRKVKTDARKGLRLAMENLEELTKKGPFFDFRPPLLEPKNTTLTITRMNKSESDLVPALILNRDRLIGFFPSADQEQTIEVEMNLSSNNVENKIVLDSGLASLGQSEINLGILDIQAHTEGEWELFQTRSGKPIGIGKHIYRYKGDKR